MFKLVLLDLDGTLLTSDKKISDFNCNIINQFKKDIRFILTSARSFKSIYPYLEQLNLLEKEDNYVISFNGGVISDNKGNKIFHKKMNENSLLVLNKFLLTNSNCECYFYTFKERISIRKVQNFQKFVQKEEIYKVICLGDSTSIKNIRKNVPDFFKNLFEITCSEPTIIEFVEKGNTKVNSIKKLLEFLLINKEEVIAIGDGENDIEMIDFVGCGVAMGNAVENVKKHANFITDTNDNDGVGKILLKLLKK